MLPKDGFLAVEGLTTTTTTALLAGKATDPMDSKAHGRVLPLDRKRQLEWQTLSLILCP